MKKNLAIVGAILLTMAFTALAGAKTTTIRWVVGNVSADNVKALVDSFQKDYPSIKVNPVVCAWNEVDDKYLAMTVGGQLVDVFVNNSVYGWARYTGKGLFTDLTPFILRDKKSLDPDDFAPLVMNAYTIKGKQYSLPIQHYLANSIAYNATLLAEAGLSLPTTDWESKNWSWDDMVLYAKKLTKVGPDGKVLQFGVDFWDADNLISYAWANGGDWYDETSYKTGVINKVVVDSPQNIKAYTMIQDLRVNHKCRPGIAPAKVGGGVDVYNQGKMGMWLDAQALQDPVRNKKNFKWGMAPFPAMTGTNRDGYAWMEVGAIPRNSQHKEEAWTFLKWLSRKGLTKGVEWPSNSARKSQWDKVLDWWPLDLCALTKAQLRQYIQGGVRHAKSLPRDIVFPSQAAYNAILTELVPALNGKKSVAQALSAAQKLAENEVKKAVRVK